VVTSNPSLASSSATMRWAGASSPTVLRAPISRSRNEKAPSAPARIASSTASKPDGTLPIAALLV
jgi:hypothetical protein